VSGPARPAAQPARRTRGREAAGQAGLLVGLLAALEGLAQHRLLDRLIRGRTWIGLVAFALIGIVTLQLGLLKLNGGIGRTLEHEALLQRENAALSIENSELSAGSRIEARASQLGMAFVPLGALRFLAASPHGDVAKAATALSSAASAEAPEVARSPSESQSSAQPSASAESSAESSTESSTESSSSASSGEASSEAEPSSGGSEESSGASSESTASARSAPAPSESAAGTAPEAGPAGGIQAGAGGE
jgi:cell division protein FtsL